MTDRDTIADEARRDLATGFRDLEILAEEYTRLGQDPAIAIELAHRSPGPLRAMARARSEAIEQAAKVAESELSVLSLAQGHDDDEGKSDRWYLGGKDAARSIAAAIRSLSNPGGQA